MKVFIAVVHHEFGATFYTDRTHEGLEGQVADYCREYWKDEWKDDESKNASNEVTIAAYFLETHGGYKESVTFGDDELIIT